MSAVSIVVLFILGISMLVTGFMLANTLTKNFQTGQSVREQLAERVNQLRYGKMLTLFGIDKTAFLHKVPLTEVESEMRTCQSCIRIDECDKTLQQSEIINDEALAFCPNASSIEKQRAVC